MSNFSSIGFPVSSEEEPEELCGRAPDDVTAMKSAQEDHTKASAWLSGRIVLDPIAMRQQKQSLFSWRKKLKRA